MSNGSDKDTLDILIALFDMGLSIAKNLKKLSSLLAKKRAKYKKTIKTQ